MRFAKLYTALRLYPIVPFNIREAKTDTYHRDTEVFGPDADEFRPERWEKIRPGWAYLPFNGGPRICIGQQFALTEAGYTITRVMQHFEKIENRDPNPWTEDLGLTLATANGTKVALTPVQY